MRRTRCRSRGFGWGRVAGRFQDDFHVLVHSKALLLFDSFFGFSIETGVGPPGAPRWGELRWDCLLGVVDVLDLQADDRVDPFFVLTIDRIWVIIYRTMNGILRA